MKPFIIPYITLAILLFCGNAPVEAQESGNLKYSEIYENFNDKLKEGCSTSDSIYILSNMFDVAQASSIVSFDEISRRIYDVSMRAGEYETALEMLRMRANTYLNHVDSLNRFKEMALKFPDSVAGKRETLTFINMQRNMYLARKGTKEERAERFNEQLRDITINPPKDLYDNIELLHSVCVNISQETHGELLVDYLDRLGDMIDRLPKGRFALRNAYYVQAAIAYSLANEPQKAIDADLKLVNIMDSLTNYYVERGRPYRSYAANKYVVYTRLLGNWEGLSDEKVDEYYKLAMKYCGESRRAAKTYENLPLPDIYYALAKKDYPRALELLKEHIDNPRLSYRRRILLRYMIDAAEAVDDKDALLYASREYNDVLDTYLANRMRERYKELQIIYDIYDIRNNYEQLKAEKQESENRLQLLIIIICSVALIGLLVLIFFLVRQWRRSKHLAVTLANSNEALRKESESLRNSQAQLLEARDAAQKANQFKTDFIKNMSHEVTVPLNAIVEYSHLIVDCTDATERPYLERYAEQVDLNSAFLTAIVNDVLNLTEIDSMSVGLHRELVDLRHVAELSIETIMPMVSKDVEVVFDPESSNLDTFTDPRRVQQILVNVISNAAKYTRRGRIFLECHAVNDGKTIAIAVSDTGPGIPANEKERIFERFVKLDPDAKGIGLGLPISRLLARLLGGDLVLDTTYTHGARFIFTLPYVLR